MTKANAFGFALTALMSVVFANLSTVSMEELVSMAYPVCIVFLFGVIGVFLFSVLSGKLLNVSPFLAIAIGVSTMVGFPGTFIISNEVAQSMGESEEERKFILDAILPKMLVAGFTTVTVGSVIMAGIMANLIR
jgi:hypothetical protein